jgi:hypothetical protein
VEVEVLDVGVARVLEAVHDERWRDRDRARREHVVDAVGPREDGQLALEHVEEVVVLAVHVRAGAVAARPEARPGRDELLPVGEDLDPPLGRVADDLAAGGR